MKVTLLRENCADFGRDRIRAITATFPLYQRDGEGYVHRVRSGWMHYNRDGLFTHTSIRFWCGANGFLYEAGKRPPKHAPASLVSQPQPGRVVCATCEGRAIGSGQIAGNKIGEHFVKFKPHVGFHARQMKAANP